VTGSAVVPVLAVGEHGHLDVGFSIGPLLLRVALLAAVLAVAGFAMMRGFLAEPDRRTTIAVVTAAIGAAALELLLSGGFALPDQVVPLLLAALAVPLYLVLSRDPARAALVSSGRRFAHWVFWLFAVLAAARFGQAWLGETERATTLLHTGVLLGLVAVAWFAVARPHAGVMASRVGAGLLAIGLVAGVGQAIVSRQTDPTPGVAATVGVEVGDRRVNVVLVPNLPGWNLVHVDGAGLKVGTDPETLAQPDSAGWLAVRLPTGRSEVVVEDRGATGSFVTDTGSAGTAPSELAGPDGVECASALLGRMLASGSVTNDVSCPSNTLTPADARGLTATINRLAVNGETRLAVLADETPRGRAAAATVREAATAHNMAIVEPGRTTAPVVVVSGRLDVSTANFRTYLAPWLAELRPEPTAATRQYVLAFRAAYPTLRPSTAGFRGWLAGQGQPTSPGTA
jgi:hypothetical protein